MSSTIDSDELPSGVEHTVDIVRPLDELCVGGNTEFTVFTDWVDLMLTALMGDDEAYLEVADAYDRDELDLFVEAFATLRLETAKQGVDVLGDVYETMGLNSENFAQHFTPHSVSESMAEVQVSTGQDDDDGPSTIADPACGSGRLLLSASQLVDDSVCFGRDKDEVCAKMAVVNFCLFGIDGYVAHGDALTMETWGAWAVRDGTVASIDPESVGW